MLFKSPIFAQASGSLAGMTFSHNRGGQYVRSRATPTDPSTPYQSFMRAILSALVTSWQAALSDAQRAAWATYASNVEMTNRVGDAVYLTGQQHFIRSNSPRLVATLPIVSDGPTIYNLGDYTPPTIVATAPTGLSLSFTDTDDWVDEDESALLLFGSRDTAPTVNYFRGPYRYAGKTEGDSVTPPTSPDALSNPFTLTADNKAFFRARVTRADGRLSSVTYLSTVVV